MSRSIILMAIVVAYLVPSSAMADRFAIVIGNHQGWKDEEPLKFAEQDAMRIQEVLTDLGGVRESNAILLLDRSAAAIRTAIKDVDARLKTSPPTNGNEPQSALIVYYSGHADARGL